MNDPDQRWDEWRRPVPGVEPVTPEPPTTSEPGWREATAPLPLDEPPPDERLDSEPQPAPANLHALRVFLVVLCALLVLALVSTVGLRATLQTPPAPTVVVTATVTQNLGSSTVAPWSPITLRGQSTGGSVSDPFVGTLLVPTSETIISSSADPDQATTWIVTLGSGITVTMGNLDHPATAPDELSQAAQAWTLDRGTSLDIATATLRTSRLGYVGWCVSGVRTAGPNQGVWCFYPTSGGSSAVGVVAMGVDITTDDLMAVVDDYIPGK